MKRIQYMVLAGLLATQGLFVIPHANADFSFVETKRLMYAQLQASIRALREQDWKYDCAFYTGGSLLFFGSLVTILGNCLRIEGTNFYNDYAEAKSFISADSSVKNSLAEGTWDCMASVPAGLGIVIATAGLIAAVVGIYKMVHNSHRSASVGAAIDVKEAEKKALDELSPIF